MSLQGTTSYKIKDPNGLYFLSFAVVGWIDVFSRKRYKDIFVESLSYCCDHKGLELYSYVIMTNHVHLIVRAKEGFNLADIIRDLKKFTAKKIISSIKEEEESRRKWMLSTFEYVAKYNSNNTKYQFWRQDNHPVELHSNHVIQQKLDYIHNNPVVEGIVANPEDYLYSSARNYSELDNMIPVDLLDS